MSTLANIAALQDLVIDLVRFECQLYQLANKLHLDLAQFSADHISLRCNQIETAQRWRKGLLQCGNLLSENRINQRSICVFNLTQSLAVGPWHIDCVELPYPGKKYYRHSGWEHIELVLAGDHNTLYQRAINLLPPPSALEAEIKLKYSSPQGENQCLPNPILSVTDGTTTIKFHTYTLRQIICSEPH